MIRDYLVTVTSKFPAYGETPGEVEVSAKTAAEAVSQARRILRRNGHDRHDGPLTYRARRAGER